MLCLLILLQRLTCVAAAGTPEPPLCPDTEFLPQALPSSAAAADPPCRPAHTLHPSLHTDGTPLSSPPIFHTRASVLWSSAVRDCASASNRRVVCPTCAPCPHLSWQCFSCVRLPLIDSRLSNLVLGGWIFFVLDM